MKTIVNSTSNMRMFFVNIFSMLAILFLIFGQIGFHFFGGKINSNTPSIYLKVVGSQLPINYEKINFNDVPNAFVYLWSILINNNWPSLAYQAIVNDDQFWLIGYFISFIIIGNFIV